MATAPMRGTENSRTVCSMTNGDENSASSSIEKIISPVARLAPSLRRTINPLELVKVKRRTSGNSALTISEVPSVEPSSMMMISGLAVCAMDERRATRRSSLRFLVVITRDEFNFKRAALIV